MNATPYPLSWPAHIKRTQWRHMSAFGKTGSRPTVTSEEREVNDELARWKDVPLSSIVISCNVSRGRETPTNNDPGVAVYFTHQKKPRVIACDYYERVACNMRAIRYTLEGLRSFDRWHVTTGAELLSQFTALPERAVAAVRWWEVLRVQEDAPIEVCKKAYQQLAAIYHPDGSGPNPTMFTVIATAWDECRRIKDQNAA